MVYALKKALARDTDANLDDVLVTKKALAEVGLYSSRDFSPYPNAALFTAIKELQRTNGIYADGKITPGSSIASVLARSIPMGAIYRCVVCGAPHGGVFSPSICWQCWNKGFR